jgi:ubiquitin carboxyl-terminal hydrolase 7
MGWNRGLLKNCLPCLQYIGHIIAPAGITYGALTPLLKNRAGLPENAELDVYEEIKYEPTVMCQRQRMQDTLMNAQLEHGDILCIQEMVHPVS